MKIPTPRQLPSGAWRVECMVEGTRYRKTFDSEADAWEYATLIKTGKADKRKTEPMTVGTAIDRYIDMKDGVLSPATISAYRRIRKNHLQSLMTVKLDHLTQEAVQRSVNAMSKDFNPKTVRNAYGLLTASLSVFLPNLTLNTTLPQKQRYDAAVPSDSDIAAILSAIPGTEPELPITMAMWLGMRMSEILGLKWKDIDFDNRIVHIRRAKVDEGEKTTKTYSSQRDLRIPEHIIELMGEPKNPEDYVVNITRRRLLTLFHRICDNAGVQQYRFHDLRHINASVMLMLNIPDKYSMQRMGHATNNMLKTVYQHTMDKKMDESITALDKYFYSKLPTKFPTPEEESLMCSGL